MDRTRNLRGLTDSVSIATQLRRAHWGYHLDRWNNQDYRVEVWVEKEALTGVFSRVCNKHNVDYFACKGYVSQSEMWRAAERHRMYEKNGQEVILLHFGDHDPSGIDMTRDIKDRLWTFGADTTVERIALTMDQIGLYHPPPNPTKLTDSRATEYIAEFGYESWELDALSPKVLADLVESEVEYYKDDDKWQQVVDDENRDKQVLEWLSSKSSQQLEEMRRNDTP